MACEFCDRSWRGDLVLENETGFVILHEDWSPRGHAMVVSKSHVQNISELDEAQWQRFGSMYRRAEKALLNATGAERAIMMKLGIQVAHLHVHIYPATAAHDRAAVNAMIDGKAHEARDASFVEKVRSSLATGQPSC